MGILRHPYGRSMRWRDLGYAIASWLGVRPTLDRALVARRSEDLEQWQDTFELFVDVIRKVAHHGLTTQRLERFESLQHQLRSNDLGVLPGISAYMRSDGPRGNALDYLLGVDSVRDLIANDEGELIPGILEVREASALYARQLRSLRVS
ncbi:MAG: hypothetical protein ACK4XJ_01380 [Fimbriimonadaceae bacterium]